MQLLWYPEGSSVNEFFPLEVLSLSYGYDLKGEIGMARRYFQLNWSPGELFRPPRAGDWLRGPDRGGPGLRPHGRRTSRADQAHSDFRAAGG